MKALSIKQPWAWLIVAGIKDIENRSWAPPKAFTLPQRIYIHAGLREDRNAYSPGFAPNDEISDQLTQREIVRWYEAHEARVTHGAIVGEVVVTAVYHDPVALWATNRAYQWHLEGAVQYALPVPYKGRLGLFEVESLRAVTS